MKGPKSTFCDCIRDVCLHMENTGSYLYTEVWKFWDVQKIKKIQTFQSIIQFSTQFATEIYYSTNLYMIPSM